MFVHASSPIYIANHNLSIETRNDFKIGPLFMTFYTGDLTEIYFHPTNFNLV